MKENHKTRLYAVEEIFCPARIKNISSCTDDELGRMILDGHKETGKDGGWHTVQDLTDENLMGIIIEGKPLIILDGGCEPCR